MKISELSGFLFFFLFFLPFFGEVKGQSDKINSLEKQLDSLRIKFNIPAIAYGVIRNDTIIVQNVIGYRNIETRERAQRGDLFHIGANIMGYPVL